MSKSYSKFGLVCTGLIILSACAQNTGLSFNGHSLAPNALISNGGSDEVLIAVAPVAPLPPLPGSPVASSPGGEPQIGVSPPEVTFPPVVGTDDGRKFCAHQGDDPPGVTAEHSRKILICHEGAGATDHFVSILVPEVSWLRGHKPHHPSDYLGMCRTSEGVAAGKGQSSTHHVESGEKEDDDDEAGAPSYSECKTDEA